MTLVKLIKKNYYFSYTNVFSVVNVMVVKIVLTIELLIGKWSLNLYVLYKKYLNRIIVIFEII